ncbi:MAG: aminopeptidase [Pseudomonadota bacterium]|nr:aminopeptidase [Pseudomonadota bacterium]
MRGGRPNGKLYLFLIGLLTLTGCAELTYYGQAVTGHWQLMSLRRPVAHLLDDPATPSDLATRLVTARDLRAFASTELGLPDNGSYRTYADLKRPYVAWNVFAAPELSLELKPWCFPLLGCVTYRGYFDPGAARRLARQLRRQGYDVYVGGVPAYSTLGWFNDPLLNTFMHWPVSRVAELVFHELAHQRLYIANDTTFNESFATAVGRLGTGRWLERHAGPDEQEAYREEARRQASVLNLIGQAREALQQLYDSRQPVAVKREAKSQILADLQARYGALREEWGGDSRFDAWFGQTLNNAQLAALTTYTHLVPAFEALFREVGEDFAAFYRAAEAIGRLPQERRAARLETLAIAGR